MIAVKGLARLMPMLLLPLHAAPSGAEVCPQNCYNSSCSTLPAAGLCQPPVHGDYGSCSSYDLPAGRLQGYSGGRSGGTLLTSDPFVVLQAPSSESLPLVIEVRIEASGRDGSGSGGVRIPGKGEVLRGCNLPYEYTSCDIVGSMSFNVALGDTFVVEGVMSVGAGLGGSAGATVTYRLIDTPPGMVIRSCQGYVVDTVVSTRPVSWGRLKRYYR